MTVDQKEHTVMPEVRRSPSAAASGAGEHRASAALLAPLRAGGLLVSLVVVIGVFSALRPETFPTAGNALSILTLAAPLAVIACGLTFVLVQGDFDLSVGSMVGLGGATAVVAQSSLHLTWTSAVGIALLVAVVIGAINGILTAYAGLSSFIVTLASGTILTGLEFGLTDQKTIYQGIDPGYAAIGQSLVGPLNSQVWIALAVAAICWLALEHTEAGRYAYAVGANPVAARLSGVRVPLLRVGGFVVSALMAAVAGILITAQASSSFSNAGQPYLLPAFAAVFLGTTLSSGGRFNLVGTVVGVVLLGVIQTGLTMLQLSTAAVNLAQGGVLLVAVLVSRIGRGRR